MRCQALQIQLNPSDASHLSLISTTAATPTANAPTTILPSPTDPSSLAVEGAAGGCGTACRGGMVDGPLEATCIGAVSVELKEEGPESAA